MQSADTGIDDDITLKALGDGPWKARIAEPKRDGFLRWHLEKAARRAVVIDPAWVILGYAA